MLQLVHAEWRCFRSRFLAEFSGVTKWLLPVGTIIAVVASAS